MGSTAWKRKQRAKGLCLYCKRPAMLGETLCAKHTWTHRQAQAKWTQRNPIKRRAARAAEYRHRKSAGLCVGCGSLLDPDADRGRVTCSNCRANLYRHPTWKGA